MDVQAAALILAWVAIIILALAVAGILHRFQGTPASTLSSPEPHRASFVTGQRLPQTSQLVVTDTGTHVLLFLSPDCVTCQEVMASASEQMPKMGVAEITACFRSSRTLTAPQNVRVVSGAAEDFDRFGVALTPYAVVLWNGLVLAHGQVSTGHSLREMVEGVMRTADSKETSS